MKKKIFLLDAYALIYRSHYAFINRPITNSKGQITSAVFGFVKTLQELIKAEKPTHLAVAFDPAGLTFRSDIYPPYKAQRPATPEDIKWAVPVIKSILKAYNIPVVQVSGFEADDVIGTLAKRFADNDAEVFMYTPDKDYIQLVSDNIYLYKPKKSGNEAEVLGVTEVCEQFGLSSPIKFIDILALWGDVSDNIPGAKGIGEKTATKLIAEFGSAEEVIANAGTLKGKIQDIVTSHADSILLSKTLATIDLNVPIALELDSLVLQPANNQELIMLFEELEFRSMLKDLSQTPVPKLVPAGVPTQGDLFDTGLFASTSSYKTIADFSKKYQLVDNENNLMLFLDKLKYVNAFCFDTETTSLDVFNCSLVGIAFSWEVNHGYFVYLPKESVVRERWMKELSLFLTSPKILKIGQNLKFDIMVLAQNGISVAGPLFDTMIAHYLLDPESRHGMDLLSERYLNYKPIGITDLIGSKGVSQLNMSQVSPERVSEYACEDADVTWQLYEIFKREIEDKQLTKLFYDIELPLVSVLAEMEMAGVRVDISSLEAYGIVLNGQLIDLDNDIKRLAGLPDLNISSPKQLGYVLFDILKLGDGSDSVKKTKSKQYSTSEEVLQKMIGQHEIVGKILDFRSLKKLLSSYIESIPQLINSKTGLIHSNFNQAVTSTGRLSSNNPNLQNIPVRGERGREIRKAFIPINTESVLLSADYSQIELRIMAHLSGDQGLIDAFIAGEDIHTATAAKIFGMPLSEVTRDMRSKAKTANFGIIYGISSFGLSQRLNIGRAEAKALIDGYFNSYPGVKSYMENVVAKARETGFVDTIFGRRRYLPGIGSNNQMMRGLAERNAINAPIQGSAADIIKIAMIAIQKEIKGSDLVSKMIMQVHDELVFNVLESELDVVRPMVTSCMQDAVALSVPLIVESGIGNTWLDAH
ncbi:DNA polymerase I [Williamwhitmania taraxaci]|uniref:DNA polymerase I n=1 Tax=Williamwhitmania taraxaci TaxID=1640674 RepID=A0A1G6GZZ7_9BACT|nr:DNA polymerase I [Williamwhitmania taraxaci]SDB87484.1 DNA polymerase I [Williamwhitmania taraxaci]